MPFIPNASRTKILRLRLRMTVPGGKSRNAVFIFIAEGDTAPFEPACQRQAEPSEPFEPGPPKAALYLCPISIQMV